jgi:hypothetical protein
LLQIFNRESSKIISGWKKKILSMGGNEVLLKPVAQAIPKHVMSLFNIPKKWQRNYGCNVATLVG